MYSILTVETDKACVSVPTECPIILLNFILSIYIPVTIKQASVIIRSVYLHNVLIFCKPRLITCSFFQRDDTADAMDVSRLVQHIHVYMNII